MKYLLLICAIGGLFWFKFYKSDEPLKETNKPTKTVKIKKHSNILLGTWKLEEAGFEAITFLENGVYAHHFYDGEKKENSGLEYGLYHYNEQTKLMILTQVLDMNGPYGLNNFTPTGSGKILVLRNKSKLELRVDENKDGKIDQWLRFDQVENKEILGTWLSEDISKDFLSLTFFSDNTYVYTKVVIDKKEASGMEMGRYSWAQNTSEFSTEQIFLEGDNKNFSSLIKDGEILEVIVNQNTLLLKYSSKESNNQIKKIPFKRL